MMRGDQLTMTVMGALDAMKIDKNEVPSSTVHDLIDAVHHIQQALHNDTSVGAFDSRVGAHSVVNNAFVVSQHYYSYVSKLYLCLGVGQGKGEVKLETLRADGGACNEVGG